MTDRVCKKITLEFEDGRIETLKQGCVIQIGPTKEDGHANASFLFANGDAEELYAVLMAALALIDDCNNCIEQAVELFEE